MHFLFVFIMYHQRMVINLFKHFVIVESLLTTRIIVFIFRFTENLFATLFLSRQFSKPQETHQKSWVVPTFPSLD